MTRTECHDSKEKINMQDKITIDDDFIIDKNKKIFQYSENGTFKRLPLNNLVSCEIFADMSFLESEKIDTYIESSYGLIPYFEDAKELKKMVSSAGSVLRIFFKDETEKIASYSKKYEEDDRKPYELKSLINNLIDE